MLTCEKLYRRDSLVEIFWMFNKVENIVYVFDVAFVFFLKKKTRVYVKLVLVQAKKQENSFYTVTQRDFRILIYQK